MPTATSSMLKWDVLVTNRQGLTRDLPAGKEKWMWVPTSATLIYGERDAVLVDAFLTIEQAHAAVEWVAASGKNLTTIYVTHGHGDHFFGIGALQDRFPNPSQPRVPRNSDREPEDWPSCHRKCERHQSVRRRAL
jgi:glyoxylase-like metal-dependent hydrolase (beta-lactamase superfamily II)